MFYRVRILNSKDP